MSVLTCASGSSCWRGLEYYKRNKILQIKKISDIEFKGVVSGIKEYEVYLNLKNARKSTCNCPLANGKMIMCKHIIATYFKAVPGSAKAFEDEQNRLEKEYDEYQENEYQNVIKFINKMTKKELIDELVQIFDYAPEWVYDDFVRRNDIDGN